MVSVCSCKHFQPRIKFYHAACQPWSGVTRNLFIYLFILIPCSQSVFFSLFSPLSSEPEPELLPSSHQLSLKKAAVALRSHEGFPAWNAVKVWTKYSIIIFTCEEKQSTRCFFKATSEHLVMLLKKCWTCLPEEGKGQQRNQSQTEIKPMSVTHSHSPSWPAHVGY